jgi:hypothetical protein
MPHITALEPGFSTADAEYPELHLNRGVLQLTFKDWREQLKRVEFTGVCAFRWQEAEELLPGEAYDGSNEVFASEWIAQHIDQAVVSTEPQLRHLRFNFNACGQLQVLCVAFAVRA